jgi:hypothetical protein
MIRERDRERLQQAGEPAPAVSVACTRQLLIILNGMIKNNAQWAAKTA